VTVEYGGGAESVDWFFETTGTEESVDFRIFSLQCRSNWGVMQDHYSALSLQLDQGLFQSNGVADWFASLDLWELFEFVVSSNAAEEYVATQPKGLNF
jgi:hypothetical protein